MFGKRIGKNWRKFEVGKVVAICDHLIFLFSSELEHKVFRKAFYVALYLLV